MPAAKPDRLTGSDFKELRGELRAAARDIANARLKLSDGFERRRKAVVEARELDVSWEELAEALSLPSKQTCAAILRDPEEAREIQRRRAERLKKAEALVGKQVKKPVPIKTAPAKRRAKG